MLIQADVMKEIGEKYAEIDLIRAEAAKDGQKPSYQTEVAINMIKNQITTLRSHLTGLSLVATGISCQDCFHCTSYEDRFPKASRKDKEARKTESFCKLFDYEETMDVRRSSSQCGQEAKRFQHVDTVTIH